MKVQYSSLASAKAGGFAAARSRNRLAAEGGVPGLREFLKKRLLPVALLLGLALPGMSGQLLAFGQEPKLEDFRNNLAPYVNTPEHAIDRMLALAALKPGETLYDLGCGEGATVIAAAQEFKIKAVGVEISGNLAKRAAIKVKNAGLQNRVKIIHGDFMKTDLSEANVVTLYLATTANDTLRPNLERYLKPSTRVVSYDYPIPGWKAIATTETEGHHGALHTIYLYQVPNSITKK
ncbi:MAG TPA: class I SAM-dependent methyltransferase [Bryobacteraceae bacterium]|nr:class I SAM-dependent methyltransferase [Bryobacteraceae bacterium]